MRPGVVPQSPGGEYGSVPRMCGDPRRGRTGASPEDEEDQTQELPEEVMSDGYRRVVRALRLQHEKRKDMTMPHLMNCDHSGEGWCLDCVKELHDGRWRWMEMDNAPKDGTLILGWDARMMRGKGMPRIMLWGKNLNTGKMAWMGIELAVEFPPSWWSPLPVVPEPKAAPTLVIGGS